MRHDCARAWGGGGCDHTQPNTLISDGSAASDPKMLNVSRQSLNLKSAEYMLRACCERVAGML
jgi:hypothetical protein